MKLRELMEATGLDVDGLYGLTKDDQVRLDYELIVHIEDSKGYEVVHAEVKPDHSIRLLAE